MAVKYSPFFKEQRQKSKFSALSEVEQGLIILKRQPYYIQEIKRLMRFPNDYFNALCLSLLKSTAHYVQQLPDWHTYNSSHAALLLDRTLRRACYALILRHHLLLPEGANKQIITEKYPLWTYVIFSSALLWKIGALHTHYKIEAYYGNITKKTEWNPLAGPLQQFGSHYRFRQEVHPENTVQDPTLLLAYLLLPKDEPVEEDDVQDSSDTGSCNGYAWIAQDKIALNFWLSALLANENAKGMLTAICFIADQLAQQDCDVADLSLELDHFEDRIASAKSEDVLALAKLMINQQDLSPLSIDELKSSKDGEHFLDWLETSINLNIFTDLNSITEIISKGYLLLTSDLIDVITMQYASTYGNLHRLPATFAKIMQKHAHQNSQSSLSQDSFKGAFKQSSSLSQSQVTHTQGFPKQKSGSQTHQNSYRGKFNPFKPGG